MYKYVLSVLVVMSVHLAAGSKSTPSTIVPEKRCSFKNIELKGRVKVVEHFGDIRVQVVNGFADIDVKKVSAFPNNCGEWQFVENFPDFTIQYVDHFPDIKVRFVSSFPGMKKQSAL